jgi:uncharacterized membrane protein
MRATGLGLITGLIAGLALAFGSFGDFLIVLVFGAIGLTIGRIVDGQLDVGHYVNRFNNRRRNVR